MFYSFTLFKNEIPTYAVCMWLGVAVAALLACFLAQKRKSITCFDVILSALYTMLFAMLGAKLLYLAVSWNDVMRVIDQMGYGVLDSIGYILNSGFVFYGGFIGGCLGLLLYVKQFHRNLSEYATLYAVVLPLGHALGRIGCFFGGCCYGMEYDGFLSVDFPIHPTLKESPVVSRLPIQLFEAAGLLLLFVLLVMLYFRVPKKPTLPLWTYLTVYPVFRFILEFFRADKVRGGFWVFSTSQWISLGILLAAGIAFYLTQVKKPEKDK